MGSSDRSASCKDINMGHASCTRKKVTAVGPASIRSPRSWLSESVDHPKRREWLRHGNPCRDRRKTRGGPVLMPSFSSLPLRRLGRLSGIDHNATSSDQVCIDSDASEPCHNVNEKSTEQEGRRRMMVRLILTRWMPRR